MAKPKSAKLEAIERAAQGGATTETVAEVTMDDALDDPKFVEFLSKYDDAESLEMGDADKKLVLDRYEVFQKKEVTGRRLQSVASEIVKDEIGLTGVEFEGLDTELETIARTNPEQFNQLATILERRERIQLDVKEKSAELRELLAGSSIDSLEEKEDDLRYMRLQKFNPFLRWMPSTKEKIDELKEKYDTDFDRVRGDLKETRKLIQDAKGQSGVIEGAKKRLGATKRQVISQGLIPAKVIAEAAKKSVRERLFAKAADPSKVSLEEFAKEGKLINEMILSGAASEMGDAHLPFGTEADMKDMLDKYREVVAQKVIATVIESVEKSARLSAIVAKIEQIVAMDGIDVGDGKVQESIVNTLQTIAADPKTTTPKRLLIRRIILKYK